MAGQAVPNFDATQMTAAQRYPNRRWAADFRSMLWLIDFTNTENWMNDVRYGIPTPPAPGSADMIDALKELVVLQQTVRATAMPEIIAQSQDFQLYFCSQLGIYPRTYPNSYLVLKCVARIGELVMAFLKRRYASVRPSQIYPRLTPPIAVPGHSSYPSGHSLISHLMAHAAYAIVPQLGDAAEKLAKRIAKNREIAGLHFWFDSEAGETAASNTFDVITTLDPYRLTLPLAKAEWGITQ